MDKCQRRFDDDQREIKNKKKVHFEFRPLDVV